MCGEQAGTAGLGHAERGSPPRVRGTGGVPCTQQVAVRITPACAGNSNFQGMVSSFFRDHPRVCGEQRNRHKARKHKRGSPPRVRGTES